MLLGGTPTSLFYWTFRDSTTPIDTHQEAHEMPRRSPTIAPPAAPRWRVGIVTLLGLALVATACGDDDSGDAGDESTEQGESTTTTEAPPADPVEFAMSWTTTDFVDESRTTEEMVRDDEVVLASSDVRTLVTPILYPGVADGGEDAEVAAVDPRPLAIFLNGLGGEAGVGGPVLLDLFDEGYVVISPNIPEIAAPASSLDGFMYQPADVSFLIDALEDPSDGQADDLAPIIDFDHIVVIGHSVGATGVFGLIGHNCCRDDRVGAAVAFGANDLRSFEGGVYDFGSVPLLLIRGDADEIAPPEDSQALLEMGGDETFLLTVPNADHFAPVYGTETDQAAPEFASAAVRQFLDTYLTDTSSSEGFDAFVATLPEGSWTITRT